MTVTYDFSLRSQSTMATLEGRFEVVRGIGDGSFGSVVLAYARGGGSIGPRKGTMVGLCLHRVENVGPAANLFGRWRSKR